MRIGMREVGGAGKITQIQTVNRLALACTKCGSVADEACDCGAPYIPALERAAVAVAANPQKSDRAIALDTGVSHPTVAKARRETTGNDLPVDARVGLDGKARRLPQARNPTDEPSSIEDEIEPRNYRSAFLIRSAFPYWGDDRSNPAAL
jgi:hypothetical protein